MGKNEIKICMGSSCFSRGNNDNLEVIKQFLEDNSLDAEIKLIGNLCEGECKTGPNIFINGTLHKNVIHKEIYKILDTLKIQLKEV